MKSGNWIPVDKRIINLFPRDREYTFMEAYISYRVDIENGEENSLNGYSRIWSWSRNKVRHFVEGLRTGEGHIVDNKGTGSGQEIRLIFKGLEEVKNNKGTTRGQQEDNQGTTTIIIEKEKNKKPLKTSSPDALRLAGKLAEMILNNNPSGAIHLGSNKKAATVEKWSDDIDKLNRLDNQEWTTIEKVIDWCQHDDFWKGNILSAEKLRKQWPKLTAKMLIAPKQSTDYMTAEKVKTLADLKMFPIDSRPAIFKKLPTETQNSIDLEISTARGVVH